MVLVVTGDNQRFNVSCPAIIQSKLINCQLKGSKEGTTDLTKITATAFLPNISGRALAKIIEYCVNYGIEPSATSNEVAFGTDGPRKLTEWEKKFIPTDIDHLLELINGAEALEIPELLDFACKILAEWMKDKELFDVRTSLRINADFNSTDDPMRSREKLWILKQ